MKNFIKDNMEYVVLIVFILLAVLFIPSVCNAAEPVDTIPFNSIHYKVIEDNTVNSKGNSTKKYYILADGYLHSTSKTTAEKIKLCQKHNAKIKLYAVVTRKNKTIKRIITL